MDRRSFLWGFLLALLEACVTPPPQPSGSVSPKNGESPIGGSSPPSSTPSPSPSLGDPPPSPTPSLIPSPTPTPQQPVVIADATGSATVADVSSVPKTLSAVGYEFTVSGADESLADPIPVNILSEDGAGSLRVFASNARDKTDHAYWISVEQPSRSIAAASNASAFIPRRNGRYLVVGDEKTEIPDTITLAGPALNSELLTPIPEYDEESDSSSTLSVLSVSLSYEIIVPYDTVLQGTKALLVFVHGAGSSSPIWDEFLAFLKSDARFREEFLKRFIVVLWRYDSQRAIDTNARAMVSALRQSYGPRLIYFVGHSMGGLLSRCGYAELFGEGLAGGIVTLGTPHRGSPLAVPLQVQCAASTQPYATAFIVLYQLFVNNFVGGMFSLRLTKRLSDYVTELDKLYSDGFLSLASFETEFGIPDREFTLWLSSGVFKGIPLTKRLASNEYLLVPSSGSFLATVATILAAIKKRISGGKKRISMIEAIEAYERETGCASVPHVVGYGGTISHIPDDASADLLARFAASGGMASLAADTSRELQQAFLRWVSRSIMPIIPTASGRTSAGNDGLVRIEDALGLAAGDPIGRRGSIDQAVVAKRRPPWMKETRLKENYTHLDIAVGMGDSEYFASVASDILAFDIAQDANRSSTLTDSERSAAVTFLRHRFEGGFLSENITASLYGSSVTIAAVPGKVNRFTASFNVLIIDYTYTNEFGEPLRKIQYYTAFLARLAGRWYFYRSPGYTLDGGLRL